MDSFLKKTKGKLLIASLAIAIGFMWLPRVVYLGSMDKKIKNYKTLKTSEDDRRRVLESVQMFEGSLRQQYARISDSADISPIIDQINAFASESKLVLLSVTRRETAAEENFTRKIIDIEGYGGFHKIGLFASRIESMTPLVKIEKCSLDRSTQAKKYDHNLGFKMNLHTFYSLEGVKA